MGVSLRKIREILGSPSPPYLKLGWMAEGLWVAVRGPDSSMVRDSGLIHSTGPQVSVI